MSYEVKISSTSARTVIARYRNGNSSRDIVFQPRALLNVVRFSNEAEFQEFKNQNKVFFEKKILIENLANEKQLAATAKENATKESVKAETIAETTAANAEVAAHETKSTLRFESGDDSSDDSRNTHKSKRTLKP